jgi:hypothetical protein
MPNRTLCLILVSAVSLSACDFHDESGSPSEPTRPPAFQISGGNGELPRFPEMLEVLPDIRIRDSADPRSEYSADELVAAIQRTDGRVFIGIKPAGAPRTRDTGVIPGIDRQTALAVRLVLQNHGVEIIRTFRHSSAVAAVIPPALVTTLRALPNVDYVEPATPGHVAQASQDTTWGVRKIRAPEAWNNVPVRGEHASVTILDTGVDSLHWWHPSGDGPANMGFRCYWVDSAGTSCYDDYGGIGHGTITAGVIAARNNAFGYIGAAHEPLRFASIKTCNAVGTCAADWVFAGLDWAIGTGWPRHIVNMSLTWCNENTAFEGLLQTAYMAGILLVGAAGNTNRKCEWGDQMFGDDTGVLWPARYVQVIAVSGTDENDQFAMPTTSCAGSRYGSQVEIAAPFSGSFMARSNFGFLGYASSCGTSISAPFVTAAAALLWSAQPQLTAVQIWTWLKSSAVPYSPASQYGAGRVDVWNALQPQPPPTYTASIMGSAEVKPNEVCFWLANTSSPHAPYTYKWFIDNQLTGTDSGIYHASASGFNLFLELTDAQQNTMYDFIDVTTDWNAPGCQAH